MEHNEWHLCGIPARMTCTGMDDIAMDDTPDINMDASDIITAMTTP